MIDQNTQFHNQSTKLWLQDNSIEIYETHNEAKSIAAEECLETLKNKTYNYVTGVSRNVYINQNEARSFSAGYIKVLEIAAKILNSILVII